MLGKILVPVILIFQIYSFSFAGEVIPNNVQPDNQSAYSNTAFHFIGGANLYLSDRASGSSIEAGIKISPMFCLIGEIGRLKYSNMDFGMSGQNAKIDYSLISKSIGARYEYQIPNLSSFGIAAQLGLENLNGEVTLHIPRTSTGTAQSFDETFFYMRPSLFLLSSVSLFGTNDIYFSAGLNIRNAKSYELGTGQISSSTDVTHKIPSSLNKMFFLNASVRF